MAEVVVVETHYGVTETVTTHNPMSPTTETETRWSNEWASSAKRKRMSLKRSRGNKKVRYEMMARVLERKLTKLQIQILSF